MHNWLNGGWLNRKLYTCVMVEDRLQVLDVDVSVEAAARIGSRIQEDDSQCIAVCHKNRVIAIANGRFVDLYGVSNNSLHPFTFLHQITISDHVTRLRSSVLNNNNEPGQDPVVATSVAFPVPGILLVGAFVGVPESENLGTESTVDPVLLLGFRFYAGSVTQFTGVVDSEKSRKVAASVQVYFSFVEPVVAIAGKSDLVIDSLRWWMCGIRVHQKQFILAGKQDGSLNMYPGLASGTHDAVRSISEPIKYVGNNSVDNAGFEFSIISEMRWRSWRIKIAEVGEELSKRYRIIWPSVRDSLDFPSFVIQTQTVKSIVLLPKSSEFSRFIAKALADSSPGHTYRYPISLIITANRLQVVGLLTEAAVDTDETFSGSGSDASEHDDSDNDDKQSECEEAQEEVATIDTEEKEHHLSGPTTIHDKYKLPPMEWKATTSAVVAANLNEDRRSKENAQEGVSTSKVSRVDYNERVTSVMQRVETLSGVMKSMRTSFQLFSSDVQQHMNLISEQLEEISRRRVTIETAQSSRIGEYTKQTCSEDMEKSYLQAQAEMARFDPGVPRGSEVGSNNQTSSLVVPHVADKYDPDHPDADWGGYVRRSYKKRFYTNQSGAKDVWIYLSGNVGPGGNGSSNDWKTSYASQTSMEATPKDTFVLGTRQNSQHKRHVAPMYEQGHGSQQNSARSQSPSSPWGSRQGSPSLSGSGSSGSLSGRRIDSRRSLLAGIGKLVAAEDLKGLHPTSSIGELHKPSIQDTSSRELSRDNVGYTGRRTML
ncbi:hypothetical protein GQ600_15401 [Phytophthora cactorum]|nr:hypothetical protein GQ600_15401 [Phytophthora cactorum]